MRGKTVQLYDFGGGVLLIALFGLPFGIALDYLWNLIVLSLSLPRLPRVSPTEKAKDRLRSYALFITLIGFLIDWGYHILIWDVIRNYRGMNIWVPAMSQSHQLLLIMAPAALLLAANFALSRSYLRLSNKQAIVLGAIMAVLTAPWIIPTLPYVAGWAA